MTYARLLVLAAVAFVAYTLGARAGRSTYRDIRRNAKTVWGSRAAKRLRKQTKRGARQLARRVSR